MPTQAMPTRPATMYARDGLRLCAVLEASSLSPHCHTDSTTGRAGHGLSSQFTHIAPAVPQGTGYTCVRLLICQLSCHSGCTHACMMGVDVVTGSSKQQAAAAARRPQTTPGCIRMPWNTNCLLAVGIFAASNLCCATRKKRRTRSIHTPNRDCSQCICATTRTHTHAHRRTHTLNLFPLESSEISTFPIHLGREAEPRSCTVQCRNAEPAARWFLLARAC